MKEARRFAFSPGAPFAACSGLESGDFDGDGNLDFALVYHRTQADVDQDGALDLIFAAEVRWLSGPAAWRVQTLRGDGTGHFAFGPQREFTCQDCDLVSAHASDQTGDGFPDLVVGTHLSFESPDYPFPISQCNSSRV